MKNLNDYLNESLISESKINTEAARKVINIIKDTIKKYKAKEISKDPGTFIEYEWDEKLYKDIKDQLFKELSTKSDIKLEEGSSNDYFNVVFVGRVNIEISEDIDCLRIGFYREKRSDLKAEEVCAELYDEYVK